MSSLSMGVQKETFSDVNAQHPPLSTFPLFEHATNGSQRVLSATSSSPSSIIFPRLPYRSLSTFDISTLLALDEPRQVWPKESNQNVQLNRELEHFKIRYENQCHELEHRNQQLDILLGQVHEENQRLKIQLEHEKQQNQIIQMSAQERAQDMENDTQRKLQEARFTHESEKQEMKRQHTRMYQDLFEETNQRLKKMETEYKLQQSSNASTVDGMDKRMIELRTNIDQLQQVKQKLDQDKSQLRKANEQLQSQVQDLTSKQRHADRDRAELIQRQENELKSLRVRYESNIDLLQKENELKKSQARKTIEELEKKLTMISEKFQGLQRLFESKVQEEQINHQKSLDQLNSEHDEKMKTVRQELRKLNEQLEQQLKQQKEILEQNERTFAKIKTDLESRYQHQVDQIMERTHHNEKQLMQQLQMEYEQLQQKNEEQLRAQFKKELEENGKRMQAEQGSTETKISFENEKKQLIHKYEHLIRKLEKQSSQKSDQQVEALMSKAHKELKSMEEEFAVRHAKQDSVISEQQKLIRMLKDEESKSKAANEQCQREKHQLQMQFDVWMKNLEKNVDTLTTRKEQLERKLSHLSKHHKQDMIECRLSYETNVKGLLSNETRLDLEDTIHSLKQQILYLQQRIAFLQEELEQYVQSYGHRPLAHSFRPI